MYRDVPGSGCKLTDRELIDLIVEKSRNDGNLFLNLEENTIWSNHFGCGFGKMNGQK